MSTWFYRKYLRTLDTSGGIYEIERLPWNHKKCNKTNPATAAWRIFFRSIWCCVTTTFRKRRELRHVQKITTTSATSIVYIPAHQKERWRQWDAYPRAKHSIPSSQTTMDFTWRSFLNISSRPLEYIFRKKWNNLQDGQWLAYKSRSREYYHNKTCTLDASST